ncbi:MAG: S-layer homology domain-containing protein [Acidimicrobiia bacterium]
MTETWASRGMVVGRRWRRWPARALATLAAVVLLAGTALADTASLEDGFLELINEERTAEGSQPLELHLDLIEGARAQAERMLEAGELFHNPDLGGVADDGWLLLGENVGVGYDVQGLHDAFMASAGHRDNVLRPGYNFAGVGVVVENDQYGEKIWVAIVFMEAPEEMANPLVSAELAGSSFSGRFADDDGSVHEPAIEALAAAGITKGCAPDRFCPDDVVTRGQLASFLVRALGLGLATVDAFVDDSGSLHEGSINALAAAGITKGCAPDRFCPTDLVTRGELATFLLRAFDL